MVQGTFQHNFDICGALKKKRNVPSDKLKPTRLQIVKNLILLLYTSKKQEANSKMCIVFPLEKRTTL